MLAAIYARKSTEQTGVAEDQKSVARQVEQGRAYAARKGWTAADEHVYVDDGISGAEFTTRPGFLRLMNALKPRPPFQVLVMSEESRLGRESIETAFALKQIVMAGVRVFFYLEDRERTLDSPTDKIMLSLATYADDLERERARQRTSDAMERKARAGHVVGGRCFGYDDRGGVDAAGVRSHVERRINEAEAAVVRQIFELAAKGYGKKRIARQLNDSGALCPRPTKGRPSAWSPSSVYEALHRPLYRGEILWRTSRKRDRWGRRHWAARPESEWIRVAAPHLRIVSEELWNAAQAQLATLRATYLKRTGGRAYGHPSGRVESKYLLSGVGVCASCGGSLYVRSRPKGQARKHSYGCSSYHLRGRSICSNCAEIPMDLANRAVLAKLSDELLAPSVVTDALERAVSQLKPSSDSNQVERLRADLAVVETEAANITTAIAAGQPLPTLLSALQQREQRRESLAREIDRAVAMSKTVSLDAKRTERELLEYLEDWRALLANDPIGARPLLRRLFPDGIRFKPLAPGIHAPVEFRGTADLFGLLTGMVGVQEKWRALQDSNLRPPGS